MFTRKRLWIALIAIMLLLLGIALVTSASRTNNGEPVILAPSAVPVSEIETPENEPAPTPVVLPAPDPENASYIFGDTVVTLQNNRYAISTSPESTAAGQITIWPVPEKGDLNNDRAADYAVLLERNVAGKLDYFAAAAVAVAGGYVGTNVLPISDVAQMQSLQITPNGLIEVVFQPTATALSIEEPAEIDFDLATFGVRGQELVVFSESEIAP